jgi:hypothetical protein
VASAVLHPVIGCCIGGTIAAPGYAPCNEKRGKPASFPCFELRAGIDNAVIHECSNIGYPDMECSVELFMIHIQSISAGRTSWR